MSVADVTLEIGALTAFCQGAQVSVMEPELFTGTREVVAHVLVKHGVRPSSSEILSAWLTEARVTGIDPREFYDMPPPADMDDVTDKLVEFMVRRRLATAGDDLKRLAIGGEGDLMEKARQRLTWTFAPMARMGVVDKTVQTHAWFQSFLEGNEAATGYRQKWCPLLDEILGSLGPEHMLVLAGKPGLGKSAFAMQIALDLASQGAKVLYCSPDMGARQTLARGCSSLSGVPFTKIWRHRAEAPTMSPFEIVQVVQARELIEALGIQFDDSSNTLDVCNTARTLGLDVVIVDYIALMRVPGVPGDKYLNTEQVTASTFALRALPCFVCIVSQTKTNSEPALDNLAWSAELGNQADKAIWIDEELARVLKNRGGPVGQVPFFFYKELMLHMELAAASSVVSIPLIL